MKHSAMYLLLVAVVCSSSIAQAPESGKAESPFSSVSSCSASDLEKAFNDWAKSAASGFGITRQDVLRRFAAGIDSVDLNADEANLKLTWNAGRNLTVDADVTNEPALFAPIKNQLIADQSRLAILQEAAKSGDDWTVTARYHREAVKNKASLNDGSGAGKKNHLPAGALAVLESARKLDAERLFKNVIAETLVKEARESFGEAIDGLKKLERKASGGSKNMGARLQDVSGKLKGLERLLDGLTGAFPELAASLGEVRESLGALQIEGALETGGARNAHERLSVLADRMIRNLEETLGADESVCQVSDRLYKLVMGQPEHPKLVNQVQGLVNRQAGDLNVGGTESKADESKEVEGEVGLASTVAKGPFDDIVALLAAAASNAPELSAEAFHRGRSDLIGPDETGFKVRFSTPLGGGRKYLDESGSFLRFLRTALKEPERIKQRRKLAFLLEYSDLDDFSLPLIALGADGGAGSPLDISGGEKWSASAAYSAEVSGGMLGDESNSDDPSRRIRYELQVAYENFPNDPMRCKDRILAKGLVTVPSFEAGTIPLGDLSIGLVWASEPEYLNDLSFDDQLSARLGFVFKRGQAKLKDL